MIGMFPQVVLYSCFDLSLTAAVPKWWFILLLVCFITYRVFDELDGKQARHTGNSSVLGMLVDHGCDSIIVATYTITLVKILLLGASAQSLLIMQLGMGVFLFQIFEEHYRGYFYLAKVNPASDSTWPVSALCIVTAINGNLWWATPITLLGFQTTYAWLLFYPLYVFVVVFMIIW
jgi:ethanolaminephosphotransferase